MAAILETATPARAAALADQVDRLAAPYLENDVVVGMTVGVLRGYESVVRGYGRLSMDDSRAPDGRTLYEIGSVSKVFTGLLLADAVTHGRMSLETPVEVLLPEGLAMPRHGEASPIRMRHLATHTSGLPRLPDNLQPADANNPYADYDGKRLAAFLRSYKPAKKPGEEAVYSNLGVGLLGAILAFDRKTSYEKTLAARLVEPLGLEDTLVQLDDTRQARLAPPHVAPGVSGHEWQLNKLVGAGGIRSTVDDLLRFAGAHLDPPEGRLGEAIDLAWRVHQEPLDKNVFAMGLGWHVARDGASRWHNGQTGGYHAALFVNRKLGAASVVLTNTATGEVDALGEQLLRLAAGAEEKPRRFEKRLDVPLEVVERYTGKYQLAPGFVFTVKNDGTKLMVGLTGQPSLPVYPKSETEWEYKAVEATLTFEVDEAGRCTAVELFQNGARQKATRIE